MLKISVGLFVIAIAVGIACSRTESQPTTEKLGAVSSPGQVEPFVIPPSWKQASWFIDPANTSACASDNNRTCSLSTCGTSGDGPCLTWGSLISRWGTTAPTLTSANTAITFMSAQPGATDTVNFAPYLNNAYVTIACTPTQIGTVTLGTVTAKNQATPQLLNAVMVDDGGAIAVGQFLVNTNRGNSEAWIYKNVSGTTWAISQPLAPGGTTAVGQVFGSIAAENNGWVIGDTVNVFTLPDVYFANLNPTQGNFIQGGPHSTVGGIYVYQCNAQSLSSGVFGAFSIGAQVALVDTKVQSIFGSLPMNANGFAVSSGGGAYVQELYNSWLKNGTWPLGLISTTKSGATNPGAAYVAGGIIANGNNVQNRLGWVSVEQDTIIGAGNSLTIESGTLDGVYLETGVSLLMLNGQVTVANDINGGNAKLWGPGAINIEASVRFAYPSGAAAAAAALLFTGGITVSGGTKGCIGVPTVGAPTLTCNTSFTAAQLDTSLGATAGCLYVPGGGSMCNVGQ